MKRTRLFPLIAMLAIACVCGITLTSVASCDTPKSIAWSYYYCAEDTLVAGDPSAARHFLKACNKSADKDLSLKADSLMEVIEQLIREREK